MSINNAERFRVIDKAERLAQAITRECYLIAGDLNEKLGPTERATPVARWFTKVAHLAQAVMLEMRLLQACSLQGLAEPKRAPYRRHVEMPNFNFGALNDRAHAMMIAFNTNQNVIACVLEQSILGSRSRLQ